MNTNVNVMAAASNTSAATVKPVKTPVNAGAKASGTGEQDARDSSFNDVLDKAAQQDDGKQEQAVSKDAADLSSDPISQALVAAAQQSAGQPAEPAKEAAPAESTASSLVAEGQGKAPSMMGSAAAAVLTGTTTNVQSGTALQNGQASLSDAALAQTAAQGNISAAGIAKNTDMGMSVQPSSIEALLQAGETGSADKNQQLLAMLTGGQAVKQPVAANDAAALVSTDAAVKNLSATAVPVAVSKNMSVTALDGTKETAAADTAAGKSVSGLWGNAVLSVETAGQPDTQQQLSSGMQQGTGQFFQQGQADTQSGAAMPMQPATDSGAAVMQQLPEEAQFDTAPVKDTGTATTTTTAPQAAPVLFQQTMQDASSVQSSAAPANQPQTDYEIPKQIVDQARLIKSTEDTQMVIKLKPEHLGELTLKVSVSANGSVNASFHSDNVQVRAAIESSMVQLRQELQAQGIRVDNVSVYAGLGDGSLGSSQQQYQQQQGGHVRSQQLDQAAFEEEADGLSMTAAGAVADVATDSGVDYRI